MTQKRCPFDAWFEGGSIHIQTFLQTTLQAIDGHVNSYLHQFKAGLKQV